MTMSALKNKVCLVTGAGSGIGTATAAALAADGAVTVLVGRRKALLDEVAATIAAAGGTAHVAPAAVDDPAQVTALVDEVRERVGPVDVLVNVAGVIVRTEPPAVTPEAWDRTFAVNVRGAYFLTQEVGARMLAGRGGSIVNVASLAGERVTGAAIPYQASKAALIQLTRALAVRWAPRVRVNAVGPGYIRTSLNAAWLGDPDNRAYVEARTPLGRVGQVEDVTGAVVFLASPAAGYITGQHLRIDGGWSAQ